MLPLYSKYIYILVQSVGAINPAIIQHIIYNEWGQLSPAIVQHMYTLIGAVSLAIVQHILFIIYTPCLSNDR